MCCFFELNNADKMNTILFKETITATHFYPTCIIRYNPYPRCIVSIRDTHNPKFSEEKIEFEIV